MWNYHDSYSGLSTLQGIDMNFVQIDFEVHIDS
jgi:hypothetical protein